MKRELFEKYEFFKMNFSKIDFFQDDVYIKYS